MFRLTPTNLGWLIAYFALIALIVIGLRRYRESAIAQYGGEQAAADWLEWRDAAERIGKDGPIARRAPKSTEPPALLLMRDHFTACLSMSLLLSSCLFVWLMISVRGALRPVDIDYENDD